MSVTSSKKAMLRLTSLAMLRTSMAMRQVSLLPRAAAPSFARMGARALSTRSESDAFGPIEVDDDALWGAQTQRR